MVQGSEDQGSRCMVWGAGLRFQGSGFRLEI